VGLLSACTAALVTDPNARNYVPTAGSKVTVKQRIEVPAGQTRIFLQRGKLIAKASQLDHYWPNCNFEINTLAETSRYIDAGVYTVRRTTRQEKEVVWHQAKSIQLAAVGIGGVMAFGGHGAQLLFEEVKMTLQSAQPSDIRNLACRGVFTDPVLVEPPTLAEIREALGDYASISVPEEQAR
jgi:hypothetical protein